MKYTIEIDRETDGRWIAEVRGLPGVLAYGRTRKEAIRRAEAIAFRVIADRLENPKTRDTQSVSFACAPA